MHEGYLPAPHQNPNKKETNPMQKLLLAAALSLVGLTLSSASARAEPLPTASQSAQQSPKDTKFLLPARLRP